MFPGASAIVYRNDAGEPIGWDYPSEDDGYVDYEEEQDRYLTNPRYICAVCGEHADYHDDEYADHVFEPEVTW